MTGHTTFQNKLNAILALIHDKKYQKFLKAFDKVCILDEKNVWVAVNTEKSIKRYQKMLLKQQNKKQQCV